jgi:CheY-like chemotaxis protein
MRGNTPTATLVPEIRRALQQLYNQTELHKSPLIQLLGLGHRSQPPLALRRLLTEVIDSLKPEATVPPQASAWRTYQILSQRYVEQLTQREVARDLGLSVRQLQRHERRALRALAEHLRTHCDLKPGATARSQAAETQTPLVAGEAPTTEQELEWLRRNVPSEPVEVSEVIRTALKVVGPLARSLAVNVDCTVPESVPRLAVQAATVRQALLIVLTAAIRTVPGGRVHIGIEPRPWEEHLQIRALRGRAISRAPDGEKLGSLEMAHQLVALSGGSLKATADDSASEPFKVTLVLPAAEQVPVMVVDDNADTLQLFEHYLARSRYRFVAVRTAEELLTMVERHTPQIIVLDVMLPGVDGWELLGRLRAHPRTCKVPAIVCTILPQEQLAYSLGAAGFVAKPVTRQAFLCALDAQMDLLLRESD